MLQRPGGRRQRSKSCVGGTNGWPYLTRFATGVTSERRVLIAVREWVRSERKTPDDHEGAGQGLHGGSTYVSRGTPERPCAELSQDRGAPWVKSRCGTTASLLRGAVRRAGGALGDDHAHPRAESKTTRGRPFCSPARQVAWSRWEADGKTTAGAFTWNRRGGPQAGTRFRVAPATRGGGNAASALGGSSSGPVVGTTLVGLCQRFITFGIADTGALP